MAYRPHSKAYANPMHPEAWGCCDFCGDIYLHRELSWQMQWEGPRLQNLQWLVCPRCRDVPQEQLRTIILTPDPMPVRNARPDTIFVDPDAPVGDGSFGFDFGSDFG